MKTDQFEVYQNRISESDFRGTTIDSILKKVKNDSLELRLNGWLSYQFLLKDDSLNFRKFNSEVVTNPLSPQKKILAGAYWDLAYFHSENEILDSSYIYYNKAYNLYKNLENDFYAGRMMLNMAILQEKVKDYINSEKSTVQALNLLPDDKMDYQYRAYNNLAIVSNGLEQYDRALEYHKKAEDIARELKDDQQISRTLNNAGVVYLNTDRFEEALNRFNAALDSDSLYFKNPELYAMLLDNKSFSNFKNGNKKDFWELSNRALKVRDSLDYKSGIVINKIHQGEVLLASNDSAGAIAKMHEAYDLSLKIQNTRYILETLLWLSKIEPKNKYDYAQRYISINDSLLKEERLIRNKFARIRFETAQYRAMNKELSQQKILITIIAIIVIVAFILFYYYQQQRSKNRALLLEQEQKKANEKIYELLLEQQEKREEGRQDERKRISGDLHDGILGRLFGARMSLGFLKDKAKLDIDPYLDELQAIEKEIRNISHNLASDDFQNSENFQFLVRKMVAEREKVSSQKFHLEISGNVDFSKLSNEKLISIYRIIQESMHNAVKHSEAKNIYIKISEENNNLVCKIEDDGIGFKQTKKQKGIGLASMSSRIEKIGGEFFIDSDDHGTTVSCTIPF